MCCKGFFRILPKRYFLAILSFLVVLLQISTRTVFTLTLVFLSATAKNSSDDNQTLGINSECYYDVGNETGSTSCVVSEDERIHWSNVVYSQVMSAYFYGYVVTQIPGGLLSQRLPAHLVFGVSCLISFILFLILPFILQYSWPAVLAVRLLQGLVEGVSLPAMNGVLTHWARRSEKTRLLTIMISGAYLSAAVGLGLTGTMICSWGWKSSFYFFSAFGMFFSIVWLAIIRETPNVDEMIGTVEQDLFAQSMTGRAVNSGSAQATSVPWKRIFLSLPVTAIFAASFCRCWVFFLLLTEQPQYFRDVYHYDIDKNGALSTLPHIFMTIVVLFGGILADGLIAKNVSKTIVRKLFNCGGFGIEAAAMLALSFVPSNMPAVAIILLCVGVGFSGFAISGYQVNPHDLAPDRASIISGVAKLGSVAGIIMPYVVVSITGNDPGPSEWAIVFRISAIIHFAGVLYYAIFASGQVQPWSGSYGQVTIANRDTNYGTIDSESLPPGPILETNEDSRMRESLFRYTIRYDQPYWYRSVCLGE